SHLLQLPRVVFHSMQPGELLSRMGDAVFIRRLVNDLFIQSGVPVLVLLGVLLVALFRYPVLAIWLLLSIIAYAGIFLLSSFLSRTAQRRLLIPDAALDTRFTETFSAIGTIRQLGTERHHNHRLDASIHDLLTADYVSGQKNLWTEEATSLLVQGF